MTPGQLRRIKKRLEEFFSDILEGMGRRERREALADYLRGLLLDGERKSMWPIAARLAEDPDKTAAVRQRIHEAISNAKWEEREMFRRSAMRISKKLPGIEAFVVDDTGFPKKGKHSVGVQRQYSGTLGRTDNCQIATSLHLASDKGGACIGMRLYLPEQWANDPKRRTKAGVPDDVVCQPKWQTALDLLDDAVSWGLSPRIVLADSGFGDCTEFRAKLDERDLLYVVGVSRSIVVWPPGVCPTPPPERRSGQRGRTRTKWTAPRCGATPMTIEDLAKSLPAGSYRKVTWLGPNGPRSARFAAVRIRTAHRHSMGRAPGDEQWLLIEWPKTKSAPRKYYLSTLPPSTSRKRLVYLTKLRWRIERDYQEMKGELGLDHFEGRSWRGFHHHVACVAAAHAFLTLERALFPPQPSKSHAAQVSSRASASAASNSRALPHVQA